MITLSMWIQYATCDIIIINYKILKCQSCYATGSIEFYSYTINIRLHAPRSFAYCTEFTVFCFDSSRYTIRTGEWWYGGMASEPHRIEWYHHRIVEYIYVEKQVHVCNQETIRDLLCWTSHIWCLCLPLSYCTLAYHYIYTYIWVHTAHLGHRL